jgi:phosphoglycolate phosphatase-like HAD superfamily hydrolase
MSDTIPIFFDFGGTLVDTLEVTRRVFKEALGKDFPSSKIKQMYKDTSSKGQSMTMFFKYPVNPVKLLVKRNKMVKLQRDIFMEVVELYPGVQETLEKIKDMDKNISLILVTQNPLMENEEDTLKLMERLFGDNHPFDKILAGEDKFDLIVHNFDSDVIARGIFIGDLPNDVYVSEMLKIPCFGVLWGYSDEKELSTPFIVSEIPELIEMVEDHLEDLKEDLVEEIGEIEFEEIDLDSDDFELID